MRVISDLAHAEPALEDYAYETRPDGRPAEGAAAETVIYRIAVRDLDVAWSIGVFEHEQTRMQSVRINLDLEALPLEDWEADDYQAVPCYAGMAKRIETLAAEGHVKLVETLASRIADMCLEDERILSARVRVEKPEALANAASVGVEICRHRADRR
jgi:dihydroneopterin aldolase